MGEQASRTGSSDVGTTGSERVPRIDVAAITDALVRRRARRAVERAMEAIEGAFYVAGRYFANAFDADRARTTEADRLLRTLERREGIIPAGGDDTNWAAEAFAADMQERIAARNIANSITRTVICSWCEAEGAPAVIHAGNPDLPVQRITCLRHAFVLFENAGLCESSEEPA